MCEHGRRESGTRRGEEINCKPQEKNPTQYMHSQSQFKKCTMVNTTKMIAGCNRTPVIFASEVASLCGIGKFANPDQIVEKIRGRLGQGTSASFKRQQRTDDYAKHTRDVDTSIDGCNKRMKAMIEENMDVSSRPSLPATPAQIQEATAQVMAFAPGLLPVKARKIARVAAEHPECVVLHAQVDSYKKSVVKVVTCEKGDKGEDIVVKSCGIERCQQKVKKELTTPSGRTVLLFGKIDGMDRHGNPIEIKTRTKGYSTKFPWQQERVQMLVYMYCMGKPKCVFKQFLPKQNTTVSMLYHWDDVLWSRVVFAMDNALATVVPLGEGSGGVPSAMPVRRTKSRPYDLSAQCHLTTLESESSDSD